MSDLFATAIIHWYMLQWHPLTPLHVAYICQAITHTGIAAPGLGTFGVKMHPPHTRLWRFYGIGVSSSSDD